ncbi:hypothetical protein [Flavobacterium sp.]|uniref:hypothetical protein n=1 Tax=Flavobacterium sp. TaxID=239 RepID=UPI00374FF13B
MKTKELEFEVDFIGEQTSLTIEEEKALSDYFKQKKASIKLVEMKKSVRKTKLSTVKK